MTEVADRLTYRADTCEKCAAEWLSRVGKGVPYYRWCAMQICPECRQVTTIHYEYRDAETGEPVVPCPHRSADPAGGDFGMSHLERVEREARARAADHNTEAE